MQAATESDTKPTLPAEPPFELRPNVGLEVLPDPPGPLLWPWLLLAAAMVAACLVWILIRRLRRPAPPLSPAEQALAAVARLRQAGTANADLCRHVLAEGAGVLRQFLQAQHGLPATARTTTEFAALLDGAAGLDAELRQLIIQLLEQADLAKFAHMAPPPEQVQEALDRVEAVVCAAFRGTMAER